MDRLMRWQVMVGLGLIFASEYFANLPFSVYPHADFWRNSPALILIRVGVMLLLLGIAYLWTEFRPAPGWSWILDLGKTSLMVYWVHVMLVYGVLAVVVNRSLTPAGSVLAAIVVTAMMIALAAIRLWQKARRAVSWKAATTVAGGVV
jgi:hypothetical protein